MRLSKVQVVTIVVASLFFSTTGVFSLYRMYRYFSIREISDPSGFLDTIIQTGPEREVLPSLYFAELLGLSQDRPTHSFFFNEKEAEQKLLSSPVIKEARVEKVLPRSIYIDYSIRRPYFLLEDFSGTGIDEEGRIIPIKPFFSPKNLTAVYLGLQRDEKTIEKKYLDLALDIHSLFEKEVQSRNTFFLERIDLSLVNHESYGKREIVLTIKVGSSIQYVRLFCDRYKEELINFFSVKEKLRLDQSSSTIRVIDLRIDDLAYVEDYPQKEK